MKLMLIMIHFVSTLAHGSTFVKVSSDEGTVLKIGASADRLYGLGSDGNIYVSQDTKTWSLQITSTALNLVDLGVAFDGTIYARSRNKVYVSTNGTTFAEIALPFHINYAKEYDDPLTDHVQALFVAADNTLYLSIQSSKYSHDSYVVRLVGTEWIYFSRSLRISEFTVFQSRAFDIGDIGQIEFQLDTDKWIRSEFLKPDKLSRIFSNLSGSFFVIDHHNKVFTFDEELKRIPLNDLQNDCISDLAIGINDKIYALECPKEKI